MKEIREEAEKHRKAKLEKYGADHKACGGSMKRYAHGGKVEHDDEKEDKALIKKEVKSDCLKHRADGGSISGGMGPKLGRGRHKGGKGKTQVNIAIGKPGGDSPSAPPPALGAGPSPGMPSAPPPRPMPPPGPAAMPPRPMGPMGAKHGGKVHEKHHAKHEKHHGHRGH